MSTIKQDTEVRDLLNVSDVADLIAELREEIKTLTDARDEALKRIEELENELVDASGRDE